MRNPLAPRDDEAWWDRVVVALAALCGAVLVFTTEGGVYRGWFAGAAFLISLAFVIVYSRRPWRTTYAGRATMLSMATTTLYTGHTTLVLWWQYPGWEKGQALTYLAILIAVWVKWRALTRASHDREHDPTV